MSLVEWISHQVISNPLVGGAAMAAVLYELRAMPAKLWDWTVRFSSVEAMVSNDESIYNNLNVWLNHHGGSDRARKLLLTEEYDTASNEWKWNYSLGVGWHYVRYAGHNFLFHRKIEGRDGMGAALGVRKPATLTIYTLGKSQVALRALLAQAEMIYRSADTSGVFVWNNGSFSLVDRKRKRPLDTIFIPPEQKKRLLDDLLAFEAGRDEYFRRGIPYRRGIALRGPPGTGKSSLILALSGVINRDIYFINLNGLTSDNDVIAAFNAVGKDGIIALEDADTIAALGDRKDQMPLPVAEDTAVPAKPVVALTATKATGITLSGLLNAVDGVTSREGRILLLTSNHLDRIDPALLRPGRIDLIETVGLTVEREAREMFRYYHPHSNGEWFEQTILPQLPMAPSRLQNLFIAYEGDDACPN